MKWNGVGANPIIGGTFGGFTAFAGLTAARPEATQNEKNARTISTYFVIVMGLSVRKSRNSRSCATDTERTLFVLKCAGSRLMHRVIFRIVSGLRYSA